MTRTKDTEIQKLAIQVAQRASAFAARGSAIFNGDILAEELLAVAINIRALAPDAPVYTTIENECDPAFPEYDRLTLGE